VLNAIKMLASAIELSAATFVTNGFT